MSNPLIYTLQHVTGFRLLYVLTVFSIDICRAWQDSLGQARQDSLGQAC